MSGESLSSREPNAFCAVCTIVIDCLIVWLCLALVCALIWPRPHAGVARRGCLAGNDVSEKLLHCLSASLQPARICTRHTSVTMSRGSSRGGEGRVFSLDQFSAYHPMIPRRYVPGWQTDMQNRRLIIKVLLSEE